MPVWDVFLQVVTQKSADLIYMVLEGLKSRVAYIS